MLLDDKDAFWPSVLLNSPKIFTDHFNIKIQLDKWMAYFLDNAFIK